MADGHDQLIPSADAAAAGRTEDVHETAAVAGQEASEHPQTTSSAAREEDVEDDDDDDDDEEAAAAAEQRQPPQHQHQHERDDDDDEEEEDDQEHDSHDDLSSHHNNRYHDHEHDHDDHDHDHDHDHDESLSASTARVHDRSAPSLPSNSNIDTTTSTAPAAPAAPAATAATAATTANTAATATATATAASTTNAATTAPERKPSLTSAFLPDHASFVSPSTYLRRARAVSKPMKPPPETAVDKEQRYGLERIREFLKVRTSYDVLPLSFRLIVLDTSLLVKKSIGILNNNGIVSAPLWDSKTSTFAGLLTTSDYINVIQYYAQNPSALSQIDQFRLDSLRDIEKAIGVTPLETISINPAKPLYMACRRMLETRARRIPLIDVDGETKRSMVVSVITQYRILKFISVNVAETQLLRKKLGETNVGTYDALQTAMVDTPVLDVIQTLVKCNISSVPILNSDGIVINVFEAVDVITLIKGGNYDGLSLTVGEALQKRSDDFPGIYTCSMDDGLDTIFDTIRKSRVHRFVIIDRQNNLRGVLTLSDILQYILLEGEKDDGRFT